MYLKKIKLYHYRNYEEQEVELSPYKNIFYGNNAQGKTNLLESIFLCSFARSYRTQKEKELIQLNEQEAIVEIEYEKKDRDGKIKVELAEKKNFYCNGIKIKKLSEILGKINLVMFYPDSIEIVKQGPNKRRRFLDLLIGQLRPSYVYASSQYLKVLEQRNMYLRQIKLESKPESMLEIWDEKLVEYGEKIYQERKRFLDKIKEKVKKIQAEITDEKEWIELEYSSISPNGYLEELRKRRKTDILRGYTSYGTHRDDFLIKMNEKELAVYGSQGQQRSMVISLKLAELEIIEEEMEEKPILLLDDFMSELDEKRRSHFLEKIKENQVIITCTEKIEDITGKTFYVQNGVIR